MYIWYFHFTTVLGIPANALKSKVLYLEMLSLSFSVSSSPRYNCRIWIATSKCNRADKVHFTLVPSGSGEWLHCEVLTVKPVSHFIFVLNLMWTYFSMLLSSRHFKCMHLLKIYSVLKTWSVDWGGLTAKERSDCVCSLSPLFSLLSIAWLWNGSVTI